MYQSEILSEPITSDRDVEVLNNGVGLVNVVSRTTASSQDLSSAEIREGCRRLVEKLQLLQPLIACFNGKSIWESFCREMLPGTYKKREFCFGRQVTRVFTFVFYFEKKKNDKKLEQKIFNKLQA